MKSQYDLLIVGTTALAAGIIEANPSLSIAVVESGILCAPEFSAALKTSPLDTPITSEGKTLLDELLSREVVKDGEVWLPALTPVFAEHFRNSTADCYFNAAITAIADVGNVYSVTFTSYGTEYHFKATQVIDTTALFSTREYFGVKETTIEKAQLNYYSVLTDSVLTDSVFTNSSFSDSVVLKSFPCPSGDFGTTRRALVEAYMKGNFEDKLLMIANSLDVKPEVKPDINRSTHNEEMEYLESLWMPSSLFDNFLTAYEKGISMKLSSKRAATFVPPTHNDGNYDIIVVGLGTAGALAAITAAKQGLSVLGIEAQEIPGGTTTAGGVAHYYGGFKGGAYREIDSFAHSFDKVIANAGKPGIGQKASALDSCLQNEKIACHFGAVFTGALCTHTHVNTHDCTHEHSDEHTYVQNPDTKNIIVNGISYLLNGEKHEAFAKYVLDCTAEASVCISAGCEMQGGRVSDGRFQPFSNIELRSYKCESGYTCSMCNTDNGVMNQYDPDVFSQNILRSSSSPIHLRTKYDKSYLGILPLLGLREGKKIVGVENICFENLIAGAFSNKPVYFGFSNLDNHSKDSALEDRIYQDWITICGLWGYGLSIPVPMGALIPKNTAGLLVAGRNVAVDHNTAFGLRMKDDCHKSGEAVGIIAALALKHGISAVDVNYEELREYLLSTGCLKLEDRVILVRQNSDELHEFPLWCDDDGELSNGIAGDRPGYYMWSAKTLNKTDLLRSLLQSSNNQTRYHAALAFSLFSKEEISADIKAITEILINCAKSQDGYAPKTSRKYVNLRSISALCALGRIGTADAVPTLKAMLFDESYTDYIPFEPSELIVDRDDLRFQYDLNIVVALCSIATMNPELRGEIKTFLDEYVSCHEFQVSMICNQFEKLDSTQTVKKLVDNL